MRRFWLLSALAIFACGSEETPRPATIVDAGPGPDAGPRAEPLSVSIEIADGLGSQDLLGDPLDLVVLPSGAPGVVYGARPVGQTSRVIRFAERRGVDDWTVEDAIVPGSAAPAQGDLLALSAAVWDGALRVAFLGGDDDGNVLTPFPTDLVLASRGAGGAWTERVLVDQSGEAVGMCPDLQNYCNFGNVVGSHAALATDGAGAWAAVYRDTHASFAEDDLRRSDVEVYRSAGGAVLVDPERGGGAWAQVAFLPSGGLMVGYFIEAQPAGEDTRGIWVAVDGPSGFERVKVSDASTTHRLGLAVASDGTAWLAWFDAGRQDLVVGRARAPYTTWTIERVDEVGSTGLHPDLALDPSGMPYVVFGYCGPVSDRSCPGNPGSRAEIRLARRVGDRFQVDTVDNGEGRGGVGFYNRIAFLPDGRLAIAYQDIRNLDVVVALVEEGTR